MSYDVYFWREEQGAKIDIDTLFKELRDTANYPGIVGLPLDVLRMAFRAEFPDIIDGGSALEWEGDGSYFQVGFTFIDERTVSRATVSCGYRLLKSHTAFDRLEQVARSLECRFYDPQAPPPKKSFLARIFG